MAERDSPGARPAGFLSRWSRRKADVRHGAAPPEEAGPPDEQAPAAGAAGSRTVPVPMPAAAADAPVDTTPSPPSSPSLADVQSLTRESDFSPFMARGVAPVVRNAAMKKLFFSDPHFNVMDGLDIYIDDYTKPAPLTAAMLARMASARVLGLLDAQPPEAAPAPGPALRADPESNGAAAASALDPTEAPLASSDIKEPTLKRKGGDEHADL